MKIVAAMCLVSVLSLLGGCGANTMQAEEMHQHEIGPAPTNYEPLIRAYLNDALKDPYSAHYEFSTPVPGKLWKGLVYGGWEYGWLCAVNVNAKNGFGGYTGNKTWGFIIRDGEIKYASHPATP